ncbi:ribonuclease E inhibitor RraB [Acinetobacter wanghuae]|uniref:Ribonuclease E inhibitor RraB n=1 Tax=Acinetobacter wanghuae TaxID=2662362 RepID=A0A5Q0P531_9GAMM|nr:ribonuclease E inhibitor RraB [Acinetobacter wanghuae]MQW91362.1 ribonuclease E inhibitor RraB [Acinetobacter wanghuae]QGA11733.1 ribonuclease E inhibitor RraB [Acinetobacter wanghuae]
MSRDYEQFPEDENGEVLWQMHKDGDDLTEPHEIEFSIAFTTEENADRCALHLLKEEQKISLFQDEESDRLEWVITIYVYLEPCYEDIVDLEQWFTKIASDFQGEYDGWGCMAYVYDDIDDEDILTS